MCIICRKENLEGLTKINCSGCTSLTSLPELPQSLTELWCYNCTSLTFLLEPHDIYLNCRNCPWLNHSQNPNFQINLSKLKMIKKFLKKYSFKRRLNHSYHLKKYFPKDISKAILGSSQRRSR